MTVAVGSSDDLVHFDRDEPGYLEIVTVESDTLRAMIRVDGALTTRSTAVLVSMIGTHVRAGRRYLRIDLARASVEAGAATDDLRAAHDCLAGLGGMLVFDHTDARTGCALRTADLHVSPTA